MEAGGELLTAYSSDKGLEIARSEQPNAILLDVMMPERDGIATLKLLRDSANTQTIPVILTSSCRLNAYCACC
ncbi:response regulator [Nodosilinea sp. LEGE 07088]|uniref:response regulator n=1 Tax=Nodosilinea sp. LEGE 07088 TaxID=2777968 RepID=UPI0034D96543